MWLSPTVNTNNSNRSYNPNRTELLQLELQLRTRDSFFPAQCAGTENPDSTLALSHDASSLATPPFPVLALLGIFRVPSPSPLDDPASARPKQAILIWIDRTIRAVWIPSLHKLDFGALYPEVVGYILRIFAFVEPHWTA